MPSTTPPEFSWPPQPSARRAAPGTGRSRVNAAWVHPSPGDGAAFESLRRSRDGAVYVGEVERAHVGAGESNTDDTSRRRRGVERMLPSQPPSPPAGGATRTAVWQATPPAAAQERPERHPSGAARFFALPEQVQNATTSPARRAILGVAAIVALILLTLAGRWALASDDGAEPVAKATSAASAVETGAPGDSGTGSSQGEGEPPSPAGETKGDGQATESGGTGTAPATASAPTTTGPASVHVTGKVNKPGVVKVPNGARVVDAIKAAGGLARGADSGSVNLARTVVDGEQIRVLSPGEAQPAAPPGGSPTSPAIAGGSPAAAPGAKVNLNTADAAQLETLPGVGPVLAGRIVQWRTENGNFTSVADLNEVSGVGEKIFARLAPLVEV